MKSWFRLFMRRQLRRWCIQFGLTGVDSDAFTEYTRNVRLARDHNARSGARSRRMSYRKLRNRFQTVQQFANNLMVP